MLLWISKLTLNRIFSCWEFEMQDELGHITSICLSGIVNAQ